MVENEAQKKFETKVLSPSLVEPGLPSLHQIIPLIQEYQQFYLKQNQTNEKIFAHFSRIVEDPEKGFLVGAWDSNGMPAGFSTVYFVPSSLSCSIYACMNDLYVLKHYRSQGLGKKIMVKVGDELFGRGIKSFDWMTQKSNLSAQKMYDSLGASKDEWAYYSIRTPLLPK